MYQRMSDGRLGCRDRKPGIAKLKKCEELDRSEYDNEYAKEIKERIANRTFPPSGLYMEPSAPYSIPQNVDTYLVQGIEADEYPEPYFFSPHKINPQPNHPKSSRGEFTMPRYIETAKQANKEARDLFDLVTSKTTVKDHDTQEQCYNTQIAEHIARLLNYGMRGAPRAVQSTVRLRFVQEATKGLPVRVTMETRTDENTGRDYNALITQGTP